MNINTIFLLWDLSEGLQNNHVESFSLHKHTLHAGNKTWVSVLFILAEDSGVFSPVFSRIYFPNGSPQCASSKLLQEGQIMELQAVLTSLA